MNTIDRYLLRQYVKNFVICFLSLIGLYAVIETSTNLNEFVRCGDKSGSTLLLMWRYFSFKSFLFFDETSGMLAMTAAMFTISWIQRHNEMTALMAAGVSRFRVLQPIFVASIAIIVLAALDRELLIPRFRHELARKPRDLIGDKPQKLDGCYDNETDVYLVGKHTFANEQKIVDPEFRLPPLLRDYGKCLLAEQAFYRKPEGTRPGGYLLDKMIEPTDLDNRPSLCLNGRPILITPRDAPDWLKPGQCFVVTKLEFDQISGTGEERARMRRYSSTRQMILRLRNPSQEFEADARVDIHARVVQPFLDITLLFLGLPLIVMRESRNVFLTMGLCMLLTTVFMAVVIGMQYVGKCSGPISPAMAAWGPLIIFVPVAVGLADTLST